jgi:hypothetical protein
MMSWLAAVENVESKGIGMKLTKTRKKRNAKGKEEAEVGNLALVNGAVTAHASKYKSVCILQVARFHVHCVLKGDTIIMSTWN